MQHKNIKSTYDFGIISWDTYAAAHPGSGPKWVKSLLAFVFPYTNQTLKGDYLPAKLFYGRDYHLVVTEKLNEIAKASGLINFQTAVDVDFLDEKLCAYLAGLGTYGDNNLLINKKYGTFFAIGIIMTDEDFDAYDAPVPVLCNHCGKCQAACPTKALDGGFQKLKCLSYLSQYSSVNYPLYDQMKVTYYGCDLCQDACPFNDHPDLGMKELANDFKSILTLDDLKRLEPNRYRKHFIEKSFHWIGYWRMLRNMAVMETNSGSMTESELENLQKMHHEGWFDGHLEYLRGKIHGKH